MKQKKREGHPHSKKLMVILIVLGIIAGLLELLTYYTLKFNFGVNIALTLILLALIIDCFLHGKHNKKNRVNNYILTAIFAILTLSHALRIFFGPLHCMYLNPLLSVYLYEALAILFGIIILSSALKRYSQAKKWEYNSSFLGFTGLIITVNHIIKMIIGICV